MEGVHLRVVFFDTGNAGDLSKSSQRVWVMPERMIICAEGMVKIAHLFRDTAYRANMRKSKSFS